MGREYLRKFMLERASDLGKDSNCRNRIPEDCLLITKFTDGHIHHLLPNKESNLIDFLESLYSTEDLDLSYFNSSEKKVVDQKPIILKNRQALGDILMMTAGIRDLKRAFPDWPVNVSTTAMHIWDNNPYLDRSLNSENAEIIEIGPGFLTNASNRDDRHFANAFRISIEEKLGISIPQGPIKPDIWMTEEEVKFPIIEPPYWIIVAGEKGDWTAKTYPFKRWQEIVSSYPRIKFVQIGAKEHRHPALEGVNVINYIGKTQDKNTGIRDLFNLFYFAEGSLGLVSFQMHLAAAFGMPCVVIAGAREPARFTRYPNHQYLCTDGCLPCASENSCWHCDLSKTCPEVVTGEDGQKYPKCVDIIQIGDVIRAIDQYYMGGRLSVNNPRKPTPPNPLVKQVEKKNLMLVPKENKKQKLENVEYLPKEFGFTWGGTFITKSDWEFLKEILDKYKVKTVLNLVLGYLLF